MIAYDLECAEGHAFEGWFDSAKEFEKQKKKGLLACPICGSTEINRVLSTFGIAKNRPHEGIPPKALNTIEAVSRFVEDNFENVGSEFTKEALKMHYGVAEHRNIRGVSSEQEEDTLRQEGVPFFKLPVLSDTAPEED